MNFWQDFFNSFVQEFIMKIKIGGKNISEGIEELLDFSAVFSIHLGAFEIPVTKAMINIFLTLLIFPILCYFLSRKREVTNPGRLQSAVESLIELLNRLCTSSGLNEAQTRAFAPFAGGLFCFILISNLMSVFSMEAAAVNPAFPIALAFFDVICVIAWGIHFVGGKGFLRSLVAPRAFMLPFNLLDYLIKPISLAFRLFGNIFGASILIAFLRAVVPLFLPQILGLWFDIGDGIIQAIVFAYLTISYVGEIVEKAEHPKGDDENRPAGTPEEQGDSENKSEANSKQKAAA